MSSKQNETGWGKLTVVKLKEELVKRKLSDKGNKLQLIDRLKKDDEAKKKKAEPVKVKQEIKKEALKIVTEDYEKLTIAQLKAALQKRNLSDFGNKIMMIRKLNENDEKKATGQVKKESNNKPQVVVKQENVSKIGEKKATGQVKKECNNKPEVVVKQENGSKIGKTIKQIRTGEEKTKIQIKKEETKMTEVTSTQKNEGDTSNIADIKKVEFDEQLLLSGMFNLGYNVMHSLKMVIIKNIAVKEADKPFLAGWLKKAKSSRIGITKKDHCDIVIKYSTVNVGNEAYISMKQELDDGVVEVVHPNFEYWGAHPALYWESLSSICELSDAPVLVEEIDDPEKSRNDQKRHCVVENIAVDLTEEDVKGTFKEARDIHVFNYDPTSAGIMLLEFDTIDKAKEFVENKKEVMVKGKKCPISHYPDRLLVWHKKADKIFAEENKQHTLSDEERITRLKVHDEIHKQKKKLMDKEDISGLEKLCQFVALTERDRPYRLSLISDAQRRLKKRIPCPEPEYLKLHKAYPTNEAMKMKNRQKRQEYWKAVSLAKKAANQHTKPNGSVPDNKPKQQNQHNQKSPSSQQSKKSFNETKPFPGSIKVIVNNKRTGGQDGYNRSQKFQKFETPFAKPGSGPPFDRRNYSAEPNHFTNQQNIQSSHPPLHGSFQSSNSGWAPGHQVPISRSGPIDTSYQTSGQNPSNRASFPDTRRFPDDPPPRQETFYDVRVPPPNIQQPGSLGPDMRRPVEKNDPFDNRAVAPFDRRRENYDSGRTPQVVVIDISRPPPLLDVGSDAAGRDPGGVGRDKPPRLFDDNRAAPGSTGERNFAAWDANVKPPGLHGDFDQRPPEKVDAYRSYTGKFDELDRGTAERTMDFDRRFTGQEHPGAYKSTVEKFAAAGRADDFNRNYPPVSTSNPPRISDPFSQSSSRPADPYTSTTGQFDDFRSLGERDAFSRSSIPSGVKPPSNFSQNFSLKEDSYRIASERFDDYDRQLSRRIDDFSRPASDGGSVKPPGLFEGFSQRSERADTFRSTTEKIENFDKDFRSSFGRVADPFRSSTGKFDDDFNRRSIGQERDFKRTVSREMDEFRRSGYQPDSMTSKQSSLNRIEADPIEFAVQKITSSIGEQVKEMLRSNMQSGVAVQGTNAWKSNAQPLSLMTLDVDQRQPVDPNYGSVEKRSNVYEPERNQWKAVYPSEWNSSKVESTFARSSDGVKPSMSTWDIPGQGNFSKESDKIISRKDELYDPFELDRQEQDAFRRNDQPGGNFRRDDDATFSRNAQPMDTRNPFSQTQRFSTRDQDVYKYNQPQYDYGFKQNNESQDRYRRNDNSYSTYGREIDPYTERNGGRNTDYMQKTSAFRAGRF